MAQRSLIKLLTMVVSLLGQTALLEGAQPEAIFNGRDLSGWVVELRDDHTHGKNDRQVWSVQDGEIHSTGEAFGFLRYKRKLCDFTLQLEYKISPQSNSGVGVRTVEYEGTHATRPSLAAYEIQIVDDAGTEPSSKSTGSLYRYVAPTVNANRPAGQWNELKIECRGPKIRVHLNGQQIHDVDQRRFSKIRRKPLCGFISLQSHGGAVRFRHITLAVEN